MKLIVALGNPGLRYKHTWHNVGWLAVDVFFDAYQENFGKSKNDKKMQAEIAEGQINEEKIILAKPQTFMNSSGLATKDLTNFYKINPQDLWIVHDDVDLPLGKIRISQDASSGGHKGVQSIIDQLGYKKFVRFRIGIKQLQVKAPTDQYVLQKISRSVKIQPILEQAAQAIDLALKEGIKAAMDRFN